MNYAELLNEILIGTHRGSTDEVADEANISYEKVNKACNDKKNNTPVDVLQGAFLVTQDPRLKRILEPQGWVLKPAKPAEPETDNLESEITDIVLAASRLIKTARDALDDNKIDKKERNALRKGIENIESQVAEAKTLIESL